MTNLMKSALQITILTALFHHAAFSQTREAGFEAMMMEKWDKAIEIYSGLTKADNTDQDAWLTIGNAYLAKGDKTKADAAFKSGFDAKPDGPLAYVCNGRQLLLQGRQAEADAQFEKAFKKAKKDMNVHRQIAESYFFFVAQGDRKPNLARASELLKRAIEINGKDFNTLMDAGYAYREQGNGGEAARHFEFASSYNPKSPLPLYMLGTVYKAGKLGDRFLLNMDAAIALDNSYTPALRAKADYLYATRKWEKARDAYKDLIEKGKDVVIEDEMQYANSLFLTKDCPGAIALVEKIIAKDGSKNYLRRLLGYCYTDTKDYDKGLQIMQDYFKIVDPEKIIARDFIYFGKLQLNSSKDTAAAIANFHKAMDKDTAEWELNEEIGNLYYAQKNYCGAAQHYQIWIDSLGTEAKSVSIYKLGFCYYFCKDDTMRYQHALQQFTRVIEMNPEAGIGYLWAGKSAAKLDIEIDSTAESIAQFGKAVPYFEKYVQLADPVKNKKDLIDAYSYLVYYHYIRKEDAVTREIITKILALDPANPTALELQKALDATPPSGGKK